MVIYYRNKLCYRVNIIGRLSAMEIFVERDKEFFTLSRREFNLKTNLRI